MLADLNQQEGGRLHGRDQSDVCEGRRQVSGRRQTVTLLAP